MRTFFTTEENLTKILHARDNNVWKQILMQQEIIYISSKNGNGKWDMTNKTLLNFHRSGKVFQVYDSFFNDIKGSRPDKTTNLGMPIYLLDIKPEEAKNIRDKYGVCCYSIKYKGKPFVVEKGWEIDSDDDDKLPTKNWNCFYDGLNTHSNSILIIDRYIFGSEWNKENGEPDEKFQDSLDNIQQILDNVLPNAIENDIVNVALVFSDENIFEKKGRRTKRYHFPEIVSKVQTMKKRIVRPYNFDIELICINHGCAYYRDTHDRFVITNYAITEAAHKLKAFNSRNQVITAQKLGFDYSYSKGIISNDKSSVPAFTMTRVINAIKELLGTPTNAPLIKHALNGVITPGGTISIRNRLLTKR